MIDDVSDIAKKYNNDPEKEHDRLIRHQLEYDITWRYLEKYLPSNGSILEVGAATGRYTLELARRGYRVTAVDLSNKEIEINQQQITEANLEQQVKFIIADARNLQKVQTEKFDAALLMGPLYHLVVEEDRKQAIMEVFERLKPSGVIFSAFISRYGILGDLIKNIPHWIENQTEVRSIIEDGIDPPEHPRGGFRGYFAEVPEIAPLHEEIGFKTLAVAGVEPAISADDESYNKLQGKQRELWLDLLFEISQEKPSVGASRHLLYIGKTP